MRAQRHARESIVFQQRVAARVQAPAVRALHTLTSSGGPTGGRYCRRQAPSLSTKKMPAGA